MVSCAYCSVLSVIIVGVAGVFHPYDRGVQKVASVIIYAITNVIAGFTAVSFYHQLEGSYSVSTGGLYPQLILDNALRMYYFQ